MNDLLQHSRRQFASEEDIIVLPPIPGLWDRIVTAILNGYKGLAADLITSAPHLAKAFRPIAEAPNLDALTAKTNLRLDGLFRLLPHAKEDFNVGLRPSRASPESLIARRGGELLRQLENLNVCDTSLLKSEGVWKPYIIGSLLSGATLHANSSNPLDLAIEVCRASGYLTNSSKTVRSQLEKIVRFVNRTWQDPDVVPVLHLAGQVYALMASIRHLMPYQFSPPPVDLESAPYVDLGSGINFVSSVASLNHHTPYYCVEPHPLPAEAIRTAVQLLGFDNVTVVEKRTEELRLAPASIGTLRVTQMHSYIPNYTEEVLKLSQSVMKGGRIIFGSLANNESKFERFLCSRAVMEALINRGWKVDIELHQPPFRYTDEDQIMLINSGIPAEDRMSQQKSLNDIFLFLESQKLDIVLGALFR